jgi:FkbM family methyltransferase
MNKLKKLLNDLFGILQTCGVANALTWLMLFVRNNAEVRRTGNLQSVDRAMGSGPFLIAHPAVQRRFRVQGQGIVSGIREMYCRDCYLRGGVLAIRDGDIVLDLGANVGNFTNLALAHGAAVRVLAVEPSQSLNRDFKRSVGLNDGFLERVTLHRGFIGQPCQKTLGIIENDPNYRDAPWLRVPGLLSQEGITHVDFLKCDIEGGEYDVLGEGSELVEMTEAIAVEIHAFAGNPDDLVQSLIARGFIPQAREDFPDGSCVLLARRRRSEGE